jgi:hypothetical protein
MQVYTYYKNTHTYYKTYEIKTTIVQDTWYNSQHTPNEVVYFTSRHFTSHNFPYLHTSLHFTLLHECTYEVKKNHNSRYLIK